MTRMKKLKLEEGTTGNKAVSEQYQQLQCKNKAGLQNHRGGWFKCSLCHNATW